MQLENDFKNFENIFVKFENILQDEWCFSTVTTPDNMGDLKECSVLLYDCLKTPAAPAPTHAITSNRRFRLGATKSCRVCARSFCRSLEFITHLDSHASQAPFWCLVCHRLIRSIRAYQLHRHSPLIDSPNLTCRYCLTSLSTSTELILHLKSKHRDSQPYLCTLCGQRYKHPCGFQAHLRVHRNERPYRCPQCDMGFNAKHHLVIHRRVHSKDRIFKCDHCPASYTQPFSLKRHRMKNHTRELPWQCSHCPVRFSHRCLLNHHMQVHTGIKTIQCPQCPRRFLRSSSLIRHLRWHSGIKPYTCTKCEAAFTYSSQLVHHLRVHDNNRPHKCPHCPRAFFIKRDWRRHLKKHPKKEDN